MNNDLQKFAQDIYGLAMASKDIGSDEQARHISDALHYALDQAGVPRGEERARFLNAN